MSTISSSSMACPVRRIAGSPFTPQIQSVSYGDPIVVRREEGHFRYFELTGTITGIGWGGYAEPNAQPWGQPHDPADVWLPFPNGLALLGSLYGFSISSHGSLRP